MAYLSEFNTLKLRSAANSSRSGTPNRRSDTRARHRRPWATATILARHRGGSVRRTCPRRAIFVVERTACESPRHEVTESRKRPEHARCRHDSPPSGPPADALARRAGHGGRAAAGRPPRASGRRPRLRAGGGQGQRHRDARAGPGPRRRDRRHEPHDGPATRPSGAGGDQRHALPAEECGRAADRRDGRGDRPRRRAGAVERVHAHARRAAREVRGATRHADRHAADVPRRLSGRTPRRVRLLARARFRQAEHRRVRHAAADARERDAGDGRRSGERAGLHRGRHDRHPGAARGQAAARDRERRRSAGRRDDGLPHDAAAVSEQRRGAVDLQRGAVHRRDDHHQRVRRGARAERGRVLQGGFVRRAAAQRQGLQRRGRLAQGHRRAPDRLRYERRAQRGAHVDRNAGRCRRHGGRRHPRQLHGRPLRGRRVALRLGGPGLHRLGARVHERHVQPGRRRPRAGPQLRALPRGQPRLRGQRHRGLRMLGDRVRRSVRHHGQHPLDALQRVPEAAAGLHRRVDGRDAQRRQHDLHAGTRSSSPASRSTR